MKNLSRAVILGIVFVKYVWKYEGYFCNFFTPQSSMFKIYIFKNQTLFPEMNLYVMTLKTHFYVSFFHLDIKKRL